MPPVLIQCQHLHGNVSGGWVLFQMVENSPTQHVGQKDIERNRVWMKFTSKRERFRAA